MTTKFEGYLPSTTPTNKIIALPVYRDTQNTRRSLDSDYPTVSQTDRVYDDAAEALRMARQRWGRR